MAEIQEHQITDEQIQILEKRIADLEKYIGIEETDIEPSELQQVESIDKKGQKLDDFIKVIDDTNFFLADLYEKYDQMESFLKEPFKQHCQNLQQKANFVLDQQDFTQEFIEKLQTVQSLEEHLNFEPLIDVKDKLKQVEKIEKQHYDQLVENETLREEAEQFVSKYNDICTSINQQLLILNQYLS